MGMFLVRGSLFMLLYQLDTYGLGSAWAAGGVATL